MDISKVTPRNDALFKMIFTDPRHERVLIHFLNSAIESKKDPIKKVKISNNELTKRHVSQKGSRLDIKAETDSGEIIDIEMQINNDLHMVGRALFYWSSLFSGQLVVGEQYNKLHRTISINILNFKLFHQDDRYWRKCHLTDDATHEKITDLAEIQFIELNKMHRVNKQSPITFWIEFFKNPYSEACTELYKFVPELKEAKEIFEQAKSDPKKRRIIEEREDAIRNYASDLASARERGKAEGRKEGIEEGRKEGMEEGKKEGRKEGIEEGIKKTAQRLFKIGLSTEQIARGTGLTVEEIEKINKS